MSLRAARSDRGHVPRHAKIYRNLAADYDRIRAESIAAFGEFKDDVQNGSYPEAKHELKIDEHEFNRFLTSLDQPSQRP